MEGQHWCFVQEGYDQFVQQYAGALLLACCLLGALVPDMPAGPTNKFTRLEPSLVRIWSCLSQWATGGHWRNCTWTTHHTHYTPHTQQTSHLLLSHTYLSYMLFPGLILPVALLKAAGETPSDQRSSESKKCWSSSVFWNSLERKCDSRLTFAAAP